MKSLMGADTYEVMTFWSLHVFFKEVIIILN